MTVAVVQGVAAEGPLPRSARPTPVIVSLFSGAGGLDLGFQQAGFELAVAIDASEAAIRTHRRNFPRSTSLQVDLTQLSPAEVAELVSMSLSADLSIGVIGGPPCQGFSNANVNSLVDDPRNRLAARYLEVVAALQRRFVVDFVVFENVPGIRRRRHAATLTAIISGLRSAGFQVSEYDLCAADFGVPQLRRRVLLLGVRDKSVERAELAEPLPWRTVHDAIGDLPAPVFYRPDLSAPTFPVHPNHWTMQPRSPKFSQEGRVKSDGRSFKQLDWLLPSPTIAFGHREIYVHPNGTRRLSIFEAMRLQGFPDEFVIEGSLSAQVDQVSNAVPPPLARGFALAVKKAVCGHA